jgi:hypothetical protein
MSAPPTPQSVRATELLADGEWHDREKVMAEIAKVITPGIAIRHAEQVRLGAGTAGSAPKERVKPRSQDFLIASGKRSLARIALRTKKFESKVDEDGKVYVRLRNPPAAAPPPPPLTYRNITSHLRRAFEILSDGEWRDRESVVRQMIRVVDTDLALSVGERRDGFAQRRAEQLERRHRRATREELIERGARFLAMSALANAKRIEKKDAETGVMVRLRTGQYGRSKTN